MLKLEDIALTVGQNTPLERPILQGLNLTLNEGEWGIIIGGNGAGKSTLFQVISGVLPPDKGKIVLMDQDITSASQRDRAPLITQVLQDPMRGTMAQMTLFENMVFALKRGQKRPLRSFTNSARKHLVQAHLEVLQMGLEHRIEDKVNTLSGGQRQALSLSMALAQDAKLLLLDEMTAALDPSSGRRLMELTHQLIREKRLTCLMITHNMEHALHYGDRLFLLKEGKFIKEYTPQDKSVLTPIQLARDVGALS